jgi:hypothetical protein
VGVAPEDLVRPSLVEVGGILLLADTCPEPKRLNGCKEFFTPQWSEPLRLGPFLAELERTEIDAGPLRLKLLP